MRVKPTSVELVVDRQLVYKKENPAGSRLPEILDGDVLMIDPQNCVTGRSVQASGTLASQRFALDKVTTHNLVTAQGRVESCMSERGLAITKPDGDKVPLFDPDLPNALVSEKGVNRSVLGLARASSSFGGPAWTIAFGDA